MSRRIGTKSAQSVQPWLLLACLLAFSSTLSIRDWWLTPISDSPAWAWLGIDLSLGPRKKGAFDVIGSTWEDWTSLNSRPERDPCTKADVEHLSMPPSLVFQRGSYGSNSTWKPEILNLNIEFVTLPNSCRSLCSAGMPLNGGRRFSRLSRLSIRLRKMKELILLCVWVPKYLIKGFP